jgi:predicted aspartyl protease
MNRSGILFLVPLLLLLWSTSAQGEIILYTDESGQTHITDDPSSVPERHKPSAKVLRQKTDTLSAEEKLVLREQEREEARLRSAEEALRLERQERQAESAGPQVRTKTEVITKVVIRGNQVLVPVTLGYKGRELQVMLLLDTGATLTTLDKRVADQLEMPGEEKAVARVVGGRLIRFRIGTLDTLLIGGLRIRNVSAGIIGEKGAAPEYAGLLGMNVLRNFRYSVDYQNGVIRWEP